jgi:hypothetical protein
VIAVTRWRTGVTQITDQQNGCDVPAVFLRRTMQVNVARLDRGHDSRANDFVVPLALQLRTLTAFDGLLIIPRPKQSFVISLSRNLSGRVISLSPISKSAII